MYFIFAGVSEWSAVYVIRGQLIASQKDAPSFHAWRENLPVAHPVPSGPSWVPRLYFYISYKLHSAFLVILPRLNSHFYLKKKKVKWRESVAQEGAAQEGVAQEGATQEGAIPALHSVLWIRFCLVSFSFGINSFRSVSCRAGLRT